MVAARRQRKTTMKKIELLVTVALAACAVAAMPTEAEMSKASKEVQEAFRKRLEEERAKNAFESSALVVGKLDKIVLPSVSFKPPTTLADAVKFLNEASVQYDFGPNKKGVKFVLAIDDDPPPAIPRISAKNMKLRDLLQLIVDVVGYAYAIEGDVVRIYKK